MPSRRSGVTTMLRKPRARAISRVPSTSSWVGSSVSVMQTVSPPMTRGGGTVPEDCSKAASPSAVVGVNPTRCMAPSRKRQTAPVYPPRSRFELAAIASNTGWTSPGDAAITFRISAVAVCRSSASLVSLNSRAFSIAMTAWSAKVCSEPDDRLSAKTPGSWRASAMAPRICPSRIMGTPKPAPMPIVRGPPLCAHTLRHRRSRGSGELPRSRMTRAATESAARPDRGHRARDVRSAPGPCVARMRIHSPSNVVTIAYRRSAEHGPWQLRTIASNTGCDIRRRVR